MLDLREMAQYDRGRPQEATLQGVLIGERVARRTRIRIVQSGRSDWHHQSTESRCDILRISGTSTARTVILEALTFSGPGAGLVPAPACHLPIFNV